MVDNNACFRDHLSCKTVRIALFVDNPLYPGINDHLGADDTGHCRAVKGRSVDVRAVLCRLDNGILFCMQPAAELMPLPGGDTKFFPQTADIETVGNA